MEEARKVAEYLGCSVPHLLTDCDPELREQGYIAVRARFSAQQQTAGTAWAI